MSVELDPPLVESDKKKSNRRFASVRRGYDPAAVDDFLVAITSRIDALETELHHERVTAEVPPQGTDLAQVPPLAPAEDASDGYTKRIARFGVVGLGEVERMLAEAKAEAATIVSEAGSEADRITREAQDWARRSVDGARAFLTKVEEDAGRMLSDIAERRREMIGEFRKMREHLLSVAQELDVVLTPAGPDVVDVRPSSTSVEAESGF